MFFARQIGRLECDITIDEEKPVYVNVFLDMRDEMALYPDQTMAGDTIRDALQCGIKNSVNGK